MSEKAQGSGNPTIFIGALVIALLSIGLAIYYIVPLNSHILVSSVAGSHYKPALAFGALAILCIIVALVTRPKRAIVEAEIVVSPSRGDGYKCPVCRANVKPGDAFCLNCGQRLPQ